MNEQEQRIAIAERKPMKASEIPIEQRYGYIIIDTPELKAKYAPKLATDEYLSPILRQWIKKGGAS